MVGEGRQRLRPSKAMYADFWSTIRGLGVKRGQKEARNCSALNKRVVPVVEVKTIRMSVVAMTLVLRLPSCFLHSCLDSNFDLPAKFTTAATRTWTPPYLAGTQSRTLLPSLQTTRPTWKDEVAAQLARLFLHPSTSFSVCSKSETLCLYGSLKTCIRGSKARSGYGSALAGS